MDIALGGTAPNPITWEQETSDSLRLKALQLIMEMIWMHKSKSGNALLSLTQILYGKKS